MAHYPRRNGQRASGSAESGRPLMLKQAIPNVFVSDFPAALAYYAGPLGFHPLFVYGDVPFYAHVARDDAILAIRHVSKPVIDHSAGEDLLSAFIEVSDVNALHQRLEAAGAHIRQAPRDEPWAMRSLIVSDLDGNLICFASNLAGAS
jgi:catechol 2,3-dioxygenase-like lactoylglutathione lyase family enzyme